MAIQVRRGLKKDFDPYKMLPGEWAVSIDSQTQNQMVWMCFAAGVVKRMGTYEDFQQLFQDLKVDLENLIADEVLVFSSAAEYANSAGKEAHKQAQSAESAANRANNIADDLEMRRDSGEFKGEKGDKGDKGEQGESGIMVPAAGMFSLYLDPETGDLYAEYPDGSAPPQFEYDADSGNLYFVTD